jgi:hypothetical protein
MNNPFWKALQNKFHDGVHTVEGIFTTSEQEALKVATAAAHYLEQNGGKVLRDAASAAVLSAELTPGDGIARASAAFASVIAVLASEGVPVIKSAVNLAIEMALADAKVAGLINRDTPAPSPEPAPVA